tara:strand:+ start:5465 stop:5572 length:108 start_codon:yes stop_codon:yes gene_type:complete
MGTVPDEVVAEEIEIPPFLLVVRKLLLNPIFGSVG